MYKLSYRLGFIAYVVLLLLSVLFFKERVIFSDFAYLIFLIVKDNSFISSQRLVAAIPELPAVLARKAELPLGSIALVYSVSLVAYYFLCYVVCGSILKQYGFALLLLLINILFASDSFYMPQGELQEGLALLMVLMAMLTYEKRSYLNLLRWIMVIACAIVAGFAHLLLIFPVVYLFLFFFIDKNHRIKRSYLYVFISLFLAIFLAKKYIFLNPYDAEKLQVLDNIISGFPDYLSTYAFRNFISRCLYLYYWIPVFWLGISIFYATHKAWYKLGLFALFSFGYVILINVCFPDATAVYLELEYMPLALMLGLPFVFDVLPRIKNKNIAVSLVLLIAFTGCLRMWLSHAKYTAHLGWERAYLAKNGDQKLIVDSHLTPADTLIMTWATPYEFWILSEIETHRTASINITDDTKPFSNIHETNVFAGAWGSETPYSELPRKYFHFTDSVSAYKFLK